MRPSEQLTVSSARGVPAAEEATAPRSDRRIPGVPELWALFGLDVANFTLLFAAFLLARAQAPATFATGHALLDPTRGGIDTLLLLTSSWFAANALHAARNGRREHVRGWVGGTALGAAIFVALKASEYTGVIEHGINIGTDLFFQYYFLITGLHLLHVIGGGVIFAIYWLRLRDPARALTVRWFETATLYWHVVDVLWIVIFPLLYLLK
ncbi:nitric oxide reductase NorE protein [Propionicimonas paludicola]|uniref:Cytochrome aa3 subunit 3 n=1 Tax=Propionicimonas paludicola TaxID=185243 RepID=A0A2A9CT23_9ACTN|nr:cytochrome c oxidase subunit 3 [Propionicimonas paludicola]PFG16790.1 nitric oxide reductase NorE protein [Propionicimonas paludicola]